MAGLEENLAPADGEIVRTVVSIDAYLVPRRLHRLAHRRIERSHCATLRHRAAIGLRDRGLGVGAACTGWSKGANARDATGSIVPLHIGANRASELLAQYPPDQEQRFD